MPPGTTPKRGGSSDQYTDIRMRTYTDVCIHIHIHIHIHIYIYIYIYIHIYIHTYIYIYAYIYVRMRGSSQMREAGRARRALDRCQVGAR